MRGVRLLVEGGGDTRGKGRALRDGFQAFLRDLRERVRERGMRWNLVMCGSRRVAYDRFLHEVSTSSDEFVVLLVDSEEEVTSSAREHLAARPGDEWTNWSGATGRQVHLMVQTMETWLIADVEALRQYYGQGFNERVLPKRQNLEMAPKQEVASGLRRATEKTQKGRYHKIRHAGELLARIDVEKVQSRCPHCKQLFDSLIAEVGAA